MTNKRINEKDQFTIEDINLELDATEDEYISANPQATAILYNHTLRTIGYKYFRDIMTVQVVKAMNGDTTSAKFVAELVEPKEDITGQEPDPVKWEVLALQLQARLQSDASAEELVVILLEYVMRLDDDTLQAVLK